MNRLLVDCLEVHTVSLAAKGHAELVHHQRSAVWNRDAAADTGGSQVLSPLEHLEQHALGFLIEAQKADELAENVVFGGARNVQLDCVFAEELAQFHPPSV